MLEDIAIVERIRNGNFDEAFLASMKELLPDYKARAKFINSVFAGILPTDHLSVFWGDRLATLDKSMGFFDDTKFNQAFLAILSDYPYDQYVGKQTIAWRLHTLVWAAQHAKALPEGDFVECGVFRGDMSWVIGEVADLKNSDRRFFLYDSFIGLDKDLLREDDYPFNSGYFEIANSFYSEEGIFENVKSRFKDWKNYFVIEGYLPRTLIHENAPERIAFLHVDLNSPAAELACFEELFDKLVSGALVILDDYGWKAYGKQKVVADDFFGERGISLLELPTGQGLAIKR